MGLEGFTEVDEGERKKKTGAFNTQSVETKFLYSISYFFISIKGERSLNFPFPSSSRLNLENSQFLPSRQRDNVMKLQRQENFENMASLSRQCCRMTISGNDVNGSRSSLLFRSVH